MNEVLAIERALRCIDEKSPTLGSDVTRVPVSAYLDPARFASELAVIFGQAPIVVGHASQLAQPGSYFTTELVGRPLLLTRPPAGPPRAFLNACRHRGTQLVTAAEGQGATTFVCPYHAWTYHCDGRLLGICHERSFGEIDRATHGLVALPLVERFGLLWLALAGEAAPPCTSALEDELRWLGLEGHVRFQPYRRRFAFNWKLGIDGGLEAYHFRYAHANTIAELFFDNLLVYEDYAPSARMTLAKRTITSLPGVARERWKLREHANLLYFLFPNTFLLAQADSVALIRMLPVSLNESDIEITMLLPEAPATDKALRHFEKIRSLMLAALEEDFVLGERIQATLASGANSHLSFGRNEALLASFHRELDARLLARGRLA